MLSKYKREEEKKMIKVLFICHGNICRSPMAEFVLKDIVKKKGLEDRFLIESAATSSEELGNPVYPPVRRLLARLGIDSQGKTARRIRESDYDNFDYLIGMDSANIRNMKAFFKKEDKIYKLLEFADIHRDVADPWYTDDFDSTYRDVVVGCNAFLSYLGF